MKIGLYILIFISKVVENALGTLRLIIVSNGKKGLGAVLQFVISLVWVFAAGAVIINVKEDPLKIFFFALGSFVGSYVGSYIEEKMALGSNMLIAIIDENLAGQVVDTLRDNDYALTVLKGEGKDKYRNILMIMVSRKKRPHVVDIIKSIDENSMIVAESAVTITGGYKVDGEQDD